MSRADKTVYPYAGNYDPDNNGMTLLEYASIEAMKGALGNEQLGANLQSRAVGNAKLPVEEADKKGVAALAEFSVRMAQALIAELEKQTP